MGIEFDPINKYIKITSPTTGLTALEIYNAIMDWCDDQPTMGYSVPMKAIGKAPLGGGVYTDSIFILQDGWKIKFWSGTYQAVITGTLITDDETARTVPPDSGSVEVVFQVSSQATLIGGEGAWSETEKNGIISDVDAIQAKTENLPTEPASEPSVKAIDSALATHHVTIDGKTKNLPLDPASESALLNHLSSTNASIEEIKEILEELKLYTRVVKKASFNL